MSGGSKPGPRPRPFLETCLLTAASPPASPALSAILHNKPKTSFPLNPPALKRNKQSQMPSDRPQLMHCATRALAAVWGTPPLLVREGGTMPVTRLLEGTLRAPALLLPFGQSTDNTHLPNERLRLVNLLRGKEAVKTLLGELGKAGKRALQAAVAEDDHRGEA